MKNGVTVEASHLSVKFGEFYAVEDISFSVNRGEIFGFLGANGAGKTTTIRVLCGLLHPTSGSVKVGNIPLENEGSEIEVKKIVGYMSQKFTLYNDLTVEENLQFIAYLRNLSSTVFRERRDFILNFISFDRPLNTLIKELPGGIKQQVSLAAAVLHDPDIVFLDEPTAGVTPRMRARFWALIRDLASLGKTVFVTTHYMDEAEQCERIALMRTGQIVAMDTPSRLKETVFSEPLYEFSAKRKMNYAQIAKFYASPFFSYFEPFGLRFHAVFSPTKDIKETQKELSRDFDIQEITPTLEDVFIKVVEGKAS